MLILSSKQGQRVYITCPDGTEIVVQVTRLNSNRAWLGFDAPKEVDIKRDNAGEKIEGDAD